MIIKSLKFLSLKMSIHDKYINKKDRSKINPIFVTSNYTGVISICVHKSGSKTIYVELPKDKNIIIKYDILFPYGIGNCDVASQWNKIILSNLENVYNEIELSKESVAIYDEFQLSIEDILSFCSDMDKIVSKQAFTINFDNFIATPAGRWNYVLSDTDIITPLENIGLCGDASIPTNCVIS